MIKGGTVMKLCSSCKEGIRSCIETQTFSAAHLYSYEKPMDIHIHDCYESIILSPAENSF